MKRIKLGLLLSISLFIPTLAFAEVGGDLNLQNKAALVSRDGYNLNLGTEGDDDLVVIQNNNRTLHIDGTTKVVTIDGSLAATTLTNPTVSGNLTFSTAAAKILPGATSLTFRNNADSASNLAIADAGVVTLREDLILSKADSLVRQATTDAADSGSISISPASAAGITRGAFISAFGNENAGNGGLIISTGDNANSNFQLRLGQNAGQFRFQNASNATMWSITGAGALVSDATNGSGLTLAKTGANVTPIISGGSSMDSDVTAVTSTHPVLYGVQSATVSDAVALIAPSADTAGAVVSLFKTRSASPNADANTIVVSGDTIGSINFKGADGASYINAAQIKASINGTPGASDMPGKLEFYTTPDGSTTLSLAMAIDRDQGTTLAGQLFSTRTSDIGWTVVDQTDNQACNTGCTNACVFGIDNATGTAVTNIVSCAATTADLCLCAGAS